LLDSPRLAGTDANDLAAAVVFAASSADVHHVVVGGRVIVANGIHQAINVSDALRTSIHELWS
jgi:cytosine/adenosine deaminase-related metal-dependent hydrolase